MDLGVLDGDFALIIFDKLAGCVLAARDPRGAESLFWGTSNFGEMLLFSNDATLLEGTCADVDAFPSGTMFCSRNGEVTGELTMLVSDDAREDAFLDDDDVDFLVGDDLAAAVARGGRGWENSRGDGAARAQTRTAPESPPGRVESLAARRVGHLTPRSRRAQRGAVRRVSASVPECAPASTITEHASTASVPSPTRRKRCESNSPPRSTRDASAS